MSCLELSSVTMPVDSGRNCIFFFSHFCKRFIQKKTTTPVHPLPSPVELLFSSGSFQPLRSQPLALTCQTASFNSPFTLLIKNKKCHSLQELQDPPSRDAALSASCVFGESSGRVEQRTCCFQEVFLVHVPSPHPPSQYYWPRVTQRQQGSSHFDGKGESGGRMIHHRLLT